MNYQWDLSLLFKGEEEIIAHRTLSLERAKSFVVKWKGRDDYLNDPIILKEALGDYEEWDRICGPNYGEVYYYSCLYSKDQDNASIRAKLNKAEELMKELSNDMEFFLLSLGKIIPEKQEAFLSDPILSDYHYFLERIFKKAKYFLSEKEERIMTLKESTSYDNWVMMTSRFLSKESRLLIGEDGKESERSFEDIITMISSKDKRVRDGAAIALNSILEDYSDIAEVEVNSVLQNRKDNDTLRGFSRPDESRHIGDGIETGVVDTLIKTVSERFDISSRFYSFKASLLGVKKLAYHERNVDYGNIDKEYSYPEAFSLVRKSLGRIDQDFQDILDSFGSKRQIDVFPQKGKHGGAYCAHGLLTQPTYILLNYTNKLNDVLTLAHEVGHGINNELMRREQNSLNFGSSLAIAEVASTFMEDYVLDEIMEGCDDETKLSILVNRIGGDISTIERQVACYLFEKELHGSFRDKGYLSKKDIGSIFKENMEAYMGSSVEQSPGSENWWVYWSHIRSYFYVYSYASGLLIAKSLQESLKNDSSFIKEIKGVLSSGLSKSPYTTFIECGIDISDPGFWNRGLDGIERSLDEAEFLAKKLGRL